MKQIPFNKWVAVYYNIRKKCLSVLDPSTRLVIQHTDKVYLRQAKFKVSKAGQERVRELKRKNVHAFVYGFVTAKPKQKIRLTALRYNPYENVGFTDPDGNIRQTAEYVEINKEKGVAIAQ